MLRHLMQGTSWIALRAPDDEKGTETPQGDPHGDEVLEHDPQAPPSETPPAGEAPPQSEAPPTPPVAPPEKKGGAPKGKVAATDPAGAKVFVLAEKLEAYLKANPGAKRGH